VAHATELSLSYADADRASHIAASVRPEVGAIDDDRSRTTLEHDGERLVVTVEAQDLVALRAAMNTWLGLVGVAERTAAIGAGR
jgi:KEOPS complex subunit Pcc1